MATEIDTLELISTMNTGREEKELLSELHHIEIPDEMKKPEARPNQYLEASNYEEQTSTPLPIDINVDKENNVTEATVGTYQGESFLKSPPDSKVATDESNSISRDHEATKIQNKTELFEVEFLEEEILKDQTIYILPPKEASTDNEQHPSTEEKPEESQRDERGSLLEDEIVTLANSGQFSDSLQLTRILETKEEVMSNSSIIGNSTSDNTQGISYKRGNVDEVESEEIEKKSEQHDNEGVCVLAADHNAEEAIKHDSGAKENIGSPYITTLTEGNSSEEIGKGDGRHSENSNTETKEKIDEVLERECDLVFLSKHEVGKDNGETSMDAASNKTEETVPYFEEQSVIGSPEEILKQEIPQQPIYVHEISEKGSPDKKVPEISVDSATAIGTQLIEEEDNTEKNYIATSAWEETNDDNLKRKQKVSDIEAIEKYENDGLNEEIEGQNTDESACKTNLPSAATKEETAEENLKGGTYGLKPKEEMNSSGTEGIQSFDTKCHIEGTVAEDMKDDINPDEDCNTQDSRELSQEMHLKETNELVGSSSLVQVSQKETEGDNMEKKMCIFIEETSIEEVEQAQKMESGTSDLLFEENNVESESRLDDVNRTSKLAEASEIGEHTNIQILEPEKNETDETGEETMSEALDEMYTTLLKGEDEREATSCQTSLSSLSEQTLEESAEPLTTDSKLGTTEVSETKDGNPDEQVFYITTHSSLTAEITGEKLEKGKYKPMDPINGTLLELIDIPMESVHTAEKNHESVEPQKLRSSTILVDEDQSSETFLEVNNTKMDEDTGNVIKLNLEAAEDEVFRCSDTTANDKILGEDNQEGQSKRSKEVESKSEAEHQIDRTQSRIETIDDVTLTEKLLGGVAKAEETENIKEKMEEESPATKFQTVSSSDKESNKITDSDLIATEKQETDGIIENIEISELQLVEDINGKPEALSITKAPEEEMMKDAEKPINNPCSPSELSEENATDEKMVEVVIHREKAETVSATVITLEKRSDGVQLVNIETRDLDAIAGDNSIGVHSTVQGEAADIMKPEDSTEIHQLTTTEHADVNKENMVLEIPSTDEIELEELNIPVANDSIRNTETEKLQEAEDIDREPEASLITKAPEEEMTKGAEKHINTNAESLLLEEKMEEVGNNRGKAETAAATVVTAETSSEGVHLANNSVGDLGKTIDDNSPGVHTALQAEAAANMEFEGDYTSQLTTTEHAEVNKAPIVVENPATDGTKVEELKISTAKPIIGDTITAKPQVVDDVKRNPEASSITKTPEDKMMKGTEKPTDISDSTMELSEEDNREEKLIGGGNHGDEAETTEETVMTAETSSADVQPANKYARDLDTPADVKSLGFHTTLESEAVSYIELENFSETTEYADVKKETVVVEKQATDETELEELKISNAYPIITNTETENSQAEADINWEPESSSQKKAPDEEIPEGAENPINITNFAFELSEECSGEELIDGVDNLRDDPETAAATVTKAETDSKGVQLASVSERDLDTTALDNSLGLHTTIQGVVDNMELLDSSVISQLTAAEHADTHKETMVLEKYATDETEIEELHISNAEPNCSEQDAHHIHESDKISTMKISDTDTYEEATNEVLESISETKYQVVETLEEGHKIPDLIHPAGHVTEQFHEQDSTHVEMEMNNEAALEHKIKRREDSIETLKDVILSEEVKQLTAENYGAKKSEDVKEQIVARELQKKTESNEALNEITYSDPMAVEKLEATNLSLETEVEELRASKILYLESEASIITEISEKEMKQGTGKPVNISRSVLEGLDEDNGEEKIHEEATINGATDTPLVTFVLETRSEGTQLGEKFTKDSDTEDQIEKLIEVNETTEGTLLSRKQKSAGDEEVAKSFSAPNSIPIEELSEELQRRRVYAQKLEEHVTGLGIEIVNSNEDSVAKGTADETLPRQTTDGKNVKETPYETDYREIEAETTVLSEETAYSDSAPTECLEAIDLNVETKQEKLRSAEDLNWESEASSIAKPPENEAAKGTEKPVDITFSVIDVPEKKSRELKPEADIFNASTATSPGTLVMETGLEEVQQGETLIKGYDVISTEENLNNKLTPANQEDEDGEIVKLEETFVGKKIVIVEKPSANENEDEEIITSDTVSKSMDQDPKDVHMDKVQHEFTEVPEFTEVAKDFIANDSIPIQELSEKPQKVDEQEKAGEHFTGLGSAVVHFYQESVAEGTAYENLAQETNEEKTIKEAPGDLELQETGKEPKLIEINAETTVLAEEMEYLHPVPTDNIEAIYSNVETEDKLRAAEDLSWESESSSIMDPPENEVKKGIEKPIDVTNSIIDVPEEKSQGLKSEADIFNAKTDTPHVTLIMETSLEDVRQGETLVKGYDMNSTDENLNIKMTRTSQEEEEVDSLKLEETFVRKEIVIAEKPTANEDEAEEILTSDIVSTSIDQDPKDVVDMDEVKHELTEVPEFIAADREVAKDFKATDSIPIQELPEELQRVGALEKADENVTSAGSADMDFYHKSVAEGTANEDLAQETSEEKTVKEAPGDLELQETVEEPKHIQIKAETTVLTEEVAYPDPVPTEYPEAMNLKLESEREEIRAAEDINQESESSSITTRPENEAKKGTEKPVDITNCAIDVPEEKDGELKSEADIFNASTATSHVTLVTETTLEEVQHGEMLIEGPDKKSTDKNLNIEIEDVDILKHEETFVQKEIVIAEKPTANEDEAEEILTSDIVSTSIDQDPKDVVDMDEVKHELTEVPEFIAADREVAKDFKATDSIPIRELSEELQRVDALEKGDETVTSAGSADMDFYHESVAEGIANENLAQETNEEKTVKEAPRDLELQETGEEPKHIQIKVETTVLTEEVAYSDPVPTEYPEAIDLKLESEREETRAAEDINRETESSSITTPPENKAKERTEKPVDITNCAIDVPEDKNRELKSEADIFSASTATSPVTLVMETSLEEVQHGEMLIEGSDMKSTDENLNVEIEEVDSGKLEGTFVRKEIVIAEKPTANEDEAEKVVIFDTVSASIDQDPKDIFDMDEVKHELTEVSEFIAEEKAVAKEFMATNTIPVQELSEELQRVDGQEKAKEHATGAANAVLEFYPESAAEGTANENHAQETNNEENVKKTPTDLELQEMGEEPECIKINAETTALILENLQEVEKHEEPISTHEYVADGQIDEPLPETEISSANDSKNQNLESMVGKINEQEFIEDRSETNEEVEHKLGEEDGEIPDGNGITKDLILVKEAIVAIQELEVTRKIKEGITEEASCIQELKKALESDEKTSSIINLDPIPTENLEAIGSYADTEEVKSGAPFATKAPEKDQKQGIENTTRDINSEFGGPEKTVEEEYMEEADTNQSKESETDTYESEIEKLISFDAVSKSMEKVDEDIQRNGDVTVVSIGMHEVKGVLEPELRREAVEAGHKIPDLADLATNLTEKFHEPSSEMLPKEQAGETTTTTKNVEHVSQKEDETLMNEYVEDALSTRTVEAALLPKESPKGLQVSSVGFEHDAVKQNVGPTEAAMEEWTAVEETAAVEPHEVGYKMKIEDSLIPNPTHIQGDAGENFDEDPIQKAVKVLDSTPKAPLNAVTKSKVTNIEEEHHKRATGTIKKEVSSEKTTLDKEATKDSLVISADEDEIRSSYQEDKLEALEYPEENASQKLETTKIPTHPKESGPTADIEEETIAEGTPIKEVYQDLLGDRTGNEIHSQEIKDSKNVKGVPTNINLQEASYTTNSRDANIEDTAIIEEADNSKIELPKHDQDRADLVEKNNLTANYEVQSTHLEASPFTRVGNEDAANKKVGEAEDVFAITQNHPVQEIIEANGAKTDMKKEDTSIPESLVDAEKPEHTLFESTRDKNIDTGSLNQREQVKAKDYPAISQKDGTVDLTVATEMVLGVQMLEKAYVSLSDKQIMSEAYANEREKDEVSTGSQDDPQNREDLITKTLDAEVEDLRAENDLTPELESNRADTGEEAIRTDERKEQTEKPESSVIPLSELLSRSTKGTSQMATWLIEERETTDKKEGLLPDKADSDEDKGAKEEEGGDENYKTDSGSDALVMVEASTDVDVRVCKKSHGILSGVGSKVKHSISKVKKVITGKSSHPKQSSPNKGIQ